MLLTITSETAITKNISLSIELFSYDLFLCKMILYKNYHTKKDNHKMPILCL